MPHGCPRILRRAYCWSRLATTRHQMRCPPISPTRFLPRRLTRIIFGQGCKRCVRPAVRPGHSRKRASWAAVQASWAFGRYAACLPISKHGPRPAPKVGAGASYCPITENWKTISIAIKAKPRAGLILSVACRDTNGQICVGDRASSSGAGFAACRRYKRETWRRFLPHAAQPGHDHTRIERARLSDRCCAASPNLRIMANACVTALQFDGLRAKGASVDHAGNSVEITAREDHTVRRRNPFADNIAACRHWAGR